MTVTNEDELAPPQPARQVQAPDRKAPVLKVVAAAVSLIALSYFAYLFVADRFPSTAGMRTDAPSASYPQQEPAAPPPRVVSQPQARPPMPQQPKAPAREGMLPPGLEPEPTEERAVPVAAPPVQQPPLPQVIQPLPREVVPMQQIPQQQPLPRQQPLPIQPGQPQTTLPQGVSPRTADPRGQAPLPGQPQVIAPQPQPPPAQPRRPRSQPETVTDDLSDASGVLPQDVSRIATASVLPKATAQVPADPNIVPTQAAGAQGLPGLAIQNSPMRPEDVYAAQQRRALAARSQTAAERVFEAAPPQPQRPQAMVAPVTPAKAQPDPRMRGEDMLPVGTPANGLVPLPPAAIGPTSLRTAAAQGDVAAQFEVAARFAEGRGVKQDFRQAHDWYQRAAAKGHVPSQYRIGTLFERGLGVPADIGRAKAWYKRAAEQGNVKAMHNLAVLSANSEGGQTPDYTTAAQWFLEAANRGLADSQFNLAVLHENGLGVRKDNVEAAKWYAIAARGGDPEAFKRRDALRARLSTVDNARLEASIAGFKRKAVDKKANEAKVAGLISTAPRR
jgi:localization factor PodJL